MRTRAPDFFLVGAPKCGTTAMHAYLRRHPQMFMPAQKELHYYGSDLHGLPTTLRPEQHDALFEGAGEADRVGVTAIWALYSREAAREIKADHPGARIVIMLRDPIEMMYALHSEHLYQAIEDIGSFPMALEAEPGRLSGRSPLPASYPAALYYYRAIATFSEQVERYLAMFGEEPGPRHPPGGPGARPGVGHPGAADVPRRRPGVRARVPAHQREQAGAQRRLPAPALQPDPSRSPALEADVPLPRGAETPGGRGRGVERGPYPATALEPGPAPAIAGRVRARDRSPRAAARPGPRLGMAAGPTSG